MFLKSREHFSIRFETFAAKMYGHGFADQQERLVLYHSFIIEPKQKVTDKILSSTKLTKFTCQNVLKFNMKWWVSWRTEFCPPQLINYSKPLAKYKSLSLPTKIRFFFLEYSGEYSLLNCLDCLSRGVWSSLSTNLHCINYLQWPLGRSTVPPVPMRLFDTREKNHH